MRTLAILQTVLLCSALGTIAACQSSAPLHEIVLSGNENKIDLTSGTSRPILNAQPDSLSIIDLAQSPPQMTTLTGITNSVIGPPSNIAISPDGRLALVANSIRVDTTVPAGWVPEFFAYVIDLTSHPPKTIGQVKTDAEPSGISFTPDGKLALIANRAAGTITVLAVDGMNVRPSQTLKVCEPAESVSDVAITPDGTTAFATVQKGGFLLMLTIKNGVVSVTSHKIAAYGQPYRCVVTPDGQLALTAGGGYGNGLDMDAVTVIDLHPSSGAPHASDYVPVGTAPESLEISPDGRLAAVVVADGSNTAAENPIHSSAGSVVILQRSHGTFVKTQCLPIGRIPEGVAFTGDGKYLLVQCHPDRKIWIFRVSSNGTVVDTGRRIDMPGMPSSLRAIMPAR